ncbi:MAG: AAA family ATPase, partial [Chloroflexota bacterium]|nr:AAA family ATPase [Chloroflexota bacterium]
MEVLNQEADPPLALRVGINTGEAVVRSGDDGQLIVGDPINVAARLQQGAGSGEVLVGPLTARLTAAAIDYDSRPAVSAKGKALPLESFRAIAPVAEVPRQLRGIRRIRAPLVGRERERRQLEDAFAQSSSKRQARLVTIIGAAGIGKSRLIEEALDQMRGLARPRVLQGRFLPYGRGITYWPFIEILRTDASVASDDDRDSAVEKLQKRISALDVIHASAVAQRLAVMLGLTLADQAMPDVPAERVRAELAWAMRRYVEALAREKPAVLVIDDLQWADPAAFDLIDHVTLRVTGVPVLWVCLARPEFVEDHPRWATGRDNGLEIDLNALSPANTSSLISQLLELEEISPGLRQRLVERSGGNPLFCEEFLRMLADEGRLINDGRERDRETEEPIRIPETIHALLAARLDSLAEAEKKTLQAASVVGERFSDGDLVGLRPELDVSRALDGLLQKGLVLQAPGSRDGDLRFKHLLVRDVAYGTLAKAERAELHDRFASLIENASRDRRGEFADIIAYHANQAFTLSVEMRLDDKVIRARAERAVSWNLLTAERARSLNDWAVLADRLSAARRPLEALDKQSDDPQRLRLRLLEAEQLAGVDAYDAAVGAARDVIQHAKSSPGVAAAAHLCLARISLRRDGYVPESETPVQAKEAARLFRSTGDLVGELEATW